MQASLSNRIIGAARLDPATYEAVERDEAATSQALLIVVLAAIASGIGSLTEGVFFLVYNVIAAIVGWAVYAGVAYLIGTRLFKTEQTRSTWGELLRTLGFAQAPGILLILAWIPLLGWLVVFVVAIWLLATTVVAIRQALDFTTGRAIGTAVVAWLVLAVIRGVVGLLVL